MEITFVFFFIFGYIYFGGIRGLNIEERVLGMKLRDCYRYMVFQFFFEYGDSLSI